jgi:hypothetical protein
MYIKMDGKDIVFVVVESKKCEIASILVSDPGVGEGSGE